MEATHPFPRRSLGSRLALPSILVLHAALSLFTSGRTEDDAFISFRYAANLVAGHGLVFNIGERVEGYTNFLWTILIALFLPVADPIVTAKVAGVACNLLLIASVAHFSARRLPVLGWLPPLLVALDPGVLAWGTRGLETSLFALLSWLSFATAASHEHRADAGRAALLAWLATLSRPEGCLVASLVALLYLLRSGEGRHPKTALRFSLGYAALLAPYLLWKLWYFGALLPNTYYAKTGGGLLQALRGFSYLSRELHGTDLACIAAILVSVSLGRPADGSIVVPKGLAQSAGVVAFVMLGAVGVLGGDYLPFRRLIVPSVAFLLAGGVGCLAILLASQRLAPLRLPLAGALLVMQVHSSIPVIERGEIYRASEERSYYLTRLGKCLRQVSPDGTSVAIEAIGRVGYYSGLPILDWHGLTDTHIAHSRPAGMGSGRAGHEKSDPSYLMSRRPDIIMTPGMMPVASEPAFPAWLMWVRRLTLRVSPPPLPPSGLNPKGAGYVLQACDCIPGAVRLWLRPGSVLTNCNPPVAADHRPVPAASEGKTSKSGGSP